ncbi:MAG: methyltransferase domain-containing protein [Pseudomonadota bacterium]|nr:methyltransferase domain-containing protein [Pseudomonadota bacterium]
MTPFEQARQCFLRGLELHNNQRYAEAEAHYRKSHALMPERVSVLVNLAAVLMPLQRADEAAAFCERALALEPGHPDALATLALCARLLSGPEYALQSLDRALEQSSDDVQLLSNRGVLLLELGRLDEALASLDAAADLAPDDTGVLCNRAAVLAALGRTADALRGYLQVFRLDPESAIAGEGFITLLLRASPADWPLDEALETLAIRAITTPWTRPIAIAPVLVALLRRQPGITALLELAEAAWPARIRPQGLDVLIAHEALLHALLENAVVPDVGLERLFANLRSWWLEACLAPPQAQHKSMLQLQCAVAIQCQLNDHLYAVTAEEQAWLKSLRAQVLHTLAAGNVPRADHLATLATYLPLASLPGSQALLYAQGPAPVHSLLDVHVREPLREASLRATLRPLTSIDDPTSRRVRQQYEENPFPKWRRIARPAVAVPLQEYVRRQLGDPDFRLQRQSQRPAVLNAGCGTGQHPLETARRLADASVLAIDLSLSSLSYAARMAEALGIDSVRFAQADIVGLDRLDMRFHLIESAGVLHHMASPLQGLRKLTALLEPGGVMRLALYSRRARIAVVAARELIAQQVHAADAEGIRNCREMILALPRDALARQVARFPDFYSLSECRDLLFHPCEHHYDVPGLVELLDHAGLDLLGFELPPQLRALFRRMHSDPNALTDAQAWAAFEARYPDSFTGMYQFWARPRA